MKRSNVRWTVIIALAMLAIGCSSGAEKAAPRAKVYKATGTVTYLGNPLIGAAVTFSPEDKQPAAIGRTNDSGEFSLTTYRAGDGAAAGKFKVLVTMTDSAAGGTPADAHGTDPQSDYSTPGNAHSAKAGKGNANILPAKFSDLSQTPLSATIDPSKDNKFPFELK